MAVRLVFFRRAVAFLMSSAFRPPRRGPWGGRGPGACPESEDAGRGRLDGSPSPELEQVWLAGLRVRTVGTGALRGISFLGLRGRIRGEPGNPRGGAGATSKPTAGWREGGAPGGEEFDAADSGARPGAVGGGGGIVTASGGSSAVPGGVRGPPSPESRHRVEKGPARSQSA